MEYTKLIPKLEPFISVFNSDIFILTFPKCCGVGVAHDPKHGDSVWV